MKRIESFNVDHLKLKRGIYVSRRDYDLENPEKILCTTFDIRIKAPNKEPVIDIPILHTIEHLGATFLRNNAKWKEQVIYWGPMGCRTGFYLILKGEFESKDIIELIKTIFQFTTDFEGDIPGASVIECGNYLEQNLPMAKYEAQKYYNEVLANIKEKNLVYPK